jgi:DNA-binding transcriptional MocR family regulator
VRTNRVTAAIVSIVLVGATLEPLIREPWDDSFPLSPYAMFAFKRPTKLTMEYAYGVTATGERRALTPWLVGSAEVLQALTIFQTARDKHAFPQLCTQIASRVASREPYDDIAEIRIVTGTHDAVDYLVRHVEGTETLRTTCKVTR